MTVAEDGEFSNCINQENMPAQTDKSCLYGINQRGNLYSGQNDKGLSSDVREGLAEQDRRGSYKYAGLSDPAYDHRNDSFFLDRQRSDYQDPTKVNPNCFTLRAMDYVRTHCHYHFMQYVVKFLSRL